MVPPRGGQLHGHRDFHSALVVQGGVIFLVLVMLLLAWNFLRSVQYDGR